MSGIAKAIEKVIRLRLSSDLRSLGFRRRARTFYRTCSNAIQIINIQANQANTGTTGKFTINVGVYIPAIEHRLRNAPTNPFPKQYEATIRQRIGQLMPVRDDYWWPVDSATSIPFLANELAEAVAHYALPWLDSLLDLNTVAKGAGRPADLTLAAVALELGRPDEAQRIVREALERSPLASANIRRFADRNHMLL